MNMIEPRVSFARDTNLSYHFPTEAGWGTLQWSHYGYISLPPDSQLPQHKSPYLLRNSRLEDGVTLLCSQRAVPKKCCYTQDLSSSQKKPSEEARRDLWWSQDYHDLISFDSFAGPPHYDPRRIALMSSLGCIVPPNYCGLKEEVLNVYAAGKTPRP